MVIGPIGSVVELQFREMPKRTERGAFRVRLVRQAADQGGTTQIYGYSHTVALHHAVPALPSLSPCGPGAATSVVPAGLAGPCSPISSSLQKRGSSTTPPCLPPPGPHPI